MKKIYVYLVGLMACIAFQSCACVALKRMNDRHITHYVQKNLGDVTAVADTLRRMAGNPTQRFPVSSLPDDLRKKVAILGEEATVSFPENYPYRKDEPCDSVVVFEHTSILLGVRELIYDFSVITQPVNEDRQYRNFYGFIRIAPRIYIRRSQIPLM
ncbi:hypothetical protein [Chitinophaga pinensis]|uniref:Uncharacterized protein n=1 Tax=Chitinophaga pinensis (strain ATCC 43595 / DSM 2588 / LMG 13176 / NBRC 15968 / NCIMB 11800 / UQM 2034) TaxID=485918 RepID=A0A979G9Q5_CHIPD|nr:hypothetical protein [Chitinophaga pinensis]ACU63328.1 hypothetical protein Cpin_5910 [Chitinophaga pinensis DSM 2588]